MMMNGRGQTSMPYAGFEPTVSASKRSWPMPRIARPLGPAKICSSEALHLMCIYGLTYYFLTLFPTYNRSESICNYIRAPYL
jgi:hypothetical protein